MWNIYLWIGIALAAVVGVIVVLLLNRQYDVFAVLVVAGVAALAAIVTAYQVQQYWQNRHPIREATAPNQALGSGSSMPSRSRPPVVLPRTPALMGPATGAAAPAAVPNPYAPYRPAAARSANGSGY